MGSNEPIGSDDLVGFGGAMGSNDAKRCADSTESLVSMGCSADAMGSVNIARFADTIGSGDHVGSGDGDAMGKAATARAPSTMGSGGSCSSKRPRQLRARETGPTHPEAAATNLASLRRVYPWKSSQRLLIQAATECQIQDKPNSSKVGQDANPSRSAALGPSGKWQRPGCVFCRRGQLGGFLWGGFAISRLWTPSTHIFGGNIFRRSLRTHFCCFFCVCVRRPKSHQKSLILTNIGK